jgi:hypothetical protein
MYSFFARVEHPDIRWSIVSSGDSLVRKHGWKTLGTYVSNTGLLKEQTYILAETSKVANCLPSLGSLSN